MNERRPALEIPFSDAEKLLKNGNGAAALAYICMKASGKCSVTELAKTLRCSGDEAASLLGELRALGLVSDVAQRLAPAEELPEYSPADLQRAGGDRSFTGLLSAVESLFGRVLSQTDVNRLFGIYDYLGLPCDVILLLVNHCVEEFRARHGEGRLPAMRIIEKEAYTWANREILTYDMAEEHLRARAERRSAMEQLRTALQIRDRELTPTERRYAESWLEMGFSVEALALAYDRTVVNTGRLVWKYMDSIVKSWHEKGLHTPEEIAAGDGRRVRPAAAQPAAGAHPQDDAARMQRMLEKLKKE